MSDSRNAMLNILADAQKLMHQRRVQGLIRSAAGGGAPSAAASSSTAVALANSNANKGGHATAASSTALTPFEPHGGRVKSINYIGARDNRSDFFDLWSRRIEAFVNDSAQTVLDLPEELDSNDRRVIHALAEKFNVNHSSVGKGAGRHMVLKKDTLFYRAANKVIDHDAIEALKNKKEAAHGSRFHLRRANHNNPTGEGALLIGAHGGDDEDDGMGGGHGGGAVKDLRMERALNALDMATNQYAYATAQQGGANNNNPYNNNNNNNSAPLHPSSSEANKYLSYNRGQQQQSAPTASATTPATVNVAKPVGGGTVEVPNTWASAMTQHKAATIVGSATSAAPHHNNNATAAAAATLKDVVTYEEQCTGCGTSTPLDYEVAQWQCMGACDVCRRESVFRLVERKRRVVVAAPAVPTATATSASVGEKRPREEEAEVTRATAEAAAVPNAAAPRAESIEREENTVIPAPAPSTTVVPEEIIKGDGDEEEEEEEEEVVPLEVDDLVSMLECNDHEGALIGWLRDYATGALQGSADAIGARILFVMGMEDVPRRGPKTAVDGTDGASSAGKRLYCKIKGTAAGVAALLQEVVLGGAVFSNATDVIIGLPNMSVAGVDVEALVHGPVSVADGLGAIAAIKERVGANQLVFGDSVKAVADL